ncbi:Dual 3'5'-cyclic-AMP and GMP phosphodiesterase 11 [Taenia solium]|eukprot:TsM_001083900 transcript=TsM_001083900 gene=TsM_001083900
MDGASPLKRLKALFKRSLREYNNLSVDDTLKACIRMFSDMQFINRFHIDYNVLCRWLLSVKKNYRSVTYHNWRHAFNVAQTMFVMFKTWRLTTLESVPTDVITNPQEGFCGLPVVICINESSASAMA